MGQGGSLGQKKQVREGIWGLCGGSHDQNILYVCQKDVCVCVHVCDWGGQAQVTGRYRELGYDVYAI